MIFRKSKRKRGETVESNSGDETNQVGESSKQQGRRKKAQKNSKNV